MEVAELFWYGCGHCYSLEPVLKRWLENKPDNAEFVKVPAIFSKRWEFHAKAHYTMNTLQVEQVVYDSFFQRIHVQRRGINSLSELKSFLEDFEFTAEQVESAFNSFEVDSNLRNAMRITRASGASGVPSIIVDGKYLTSAAQAGGAPQMFSVVNKLVEKAAAERAASE
ncbi:MAG: thiol:disulfide interchange protein DsbA/DsbL [Pseudomonadota bacterium]